jgi:hypothetical protein
VILCAVCTVHVETRSAVSWLSLKTKVDSLSVVWSQNHWNGFLRFGLKTSDDGFLWFVLKTGGDGFLVESQNQGGGGFSGLALKPAATVW